MKEVQSGMIRLSMRPTATTVFIFLSLLALAVSTARAESRDEGAQPAPRGAAIQTQSGSYDPFDAYWDHWDPFEEIARMRRHMNRRVRPSGITPPAAGFVRPFAENSADFQPDLDVQEFPDRYTVQVDLPGMSKETIDLQVKDRELTLTGERGEFASVQKQNYVSAERRFGRFSRTVMFAEPVRIDDVTASYENGVLEVVLPRREPERQESKTVTIN